MRKGGRVYGAAITTHAKWTAVGMANSSEVWLFLLFHVLNDPCLKGSSRCFHGYHYVCMPL